MKSNNQRHNPTLLGMAYGSCLIFIQLILFRYVSTEPVLHETMLAVKSFWQPSLYKQISLISNNPDLVLMSPTAILSALFFSMLFFFIKTDWKNNNCMLSKTTDNTHRIKPYILLANGTVFVGTTVFLFFYINTDFVNAYRFSKAGIAANAMANSLIGLWLHSSIFFIGLFIGCVAISSALVFLLSTLRRNLGIGS
ncbi:hypothetical protein O4G98_14905 [Zoogloeaceae bacterium G21618-S1]|nr:hypothetical protein [Zoogloeaceae bacterium G21618-S1]